MKNRLGVYEKALPADLSWEERLSAAGEAGFDFLEISIDESDARLSRLGEGADFRRMLRDVGRAVEVPIETMCLSGHRKYPLGSSDLATEARSVRILEDAVAFAADTDIRIIQLAGYDVYYDEPSTPRTRERMVKNLRKGAAMAASHGVLLALETMENDFCNTVSKAMSLVREVDSPYLQVYPDVGNVRNAMPDIEETLHDFGTGRGHLVAAHLKETAPGVFRDLFYGEGYVEFPAVTAALKALGVHRYNAEFWYHGEKNWRERLASAASYLGGLLKEEV